MLTDAGNSAQFLSRSWKRWFEGAEGAPGKAAKVPQLQQQFVGENKFVVLVAVNVCIFLMVALADR